MKNTMLFICLICVGVCLSISFVGKAQQHYPSEYWIDEFWGAEAWAFGLGFLGMAQTGRGIMNNSDYDENDYEGNHFRAAIWHGTRAIGAGIGAMLVGAEKNVKGNVFLAYALPVVYFAIPDIAYDLLCKKEPSEAVCDLLNSVIYLTTYIPFVPAVLAVVGYNIGATMVLQ